MNNLKKYTYQLKTLSKVILSPRQQQAFYRGIDFKNDEPGVDARVNIIYPFYQRGEYTSYQKENQYYIPGSSIKGALLASKEKPTRSKLFVDDLPLESKNIVPSHLNKLQNIEKENRQLKLEVFFPNVWIQMCEAGIELTNKGVIYSEKSPDVYFEEAHERTKKMIRCWLKNLKELCDSKEIVENTKNEIMENTCPSLKEVQKKSDSYLIFLGGYKGLLLSKVKTFEDEEAQSGFYIDKESHLPYGLVEISKVSESK